MKAVARRVSWRVNQDCSYTLKATRSPSYHGSSGQALGDSGWPGHMSFEYGMPQNSSKPCCCGRKGSRWPRCHLPKIAVR